MLILVILGILLLLCVGYFTIKRQGTRGAVLIAGLLIIGIIWGLEDQFGYDGDIVTVVLSAIFFVGLYIYDKRKKL